jgi:muconolactone delta-isomerase
VVVFRHQKRRKFAERALTLYTYLDARAVRKVSRQEAQGAKEVSRAGLLSALWCAPHLYVFKTPSQRDDAIKISLGRVCLRLLRNIHTYIAQGAENGR